MAFWGGAKILIEVEKQGIVQPFCKDQIDCSAYTLTLGEEAFVTPSFGDDPRNNQKRSLCEPSTEVVGGKKKKKGGGSVIIPPGQFAFLLTQEIVCIPKNVMGFISLKSGAKFRGLINVSGFHVDPGFTGRLVYSVFNAGPTALHLFRGDDLFLLWLADLSGRVQDPYYKTKPGYVDIPSDLVTDVARETHSLQDLANRVDAISESFRTFKSIAAGVATALGLAIAVLSLVATAITLMPTNANGSSKSARDGEISRGQMPEGADQVKRAIENSAPVETNSQKAKPSPSPT